MITIAAVDSSVADKVAADVVCDGANDQRDINTALGSGRVEVFLFNGNYQIDAPIDLPNGATLRGNSVAGVSLLCNTPGGVVRSSVPADLHEHVLLDSLRFAPGSRNDLGCDLRGFVRSQFNRLRIGSFDVGIWFGGDLPTYTSCWTNVFSQFYLSQNLVGFKFSGTNGKGSPTANNITLVQGEIICKDENGAIAIDVIDGEITVESCDIGYGDLSEGIVLREGATSCRIVNSRFEWDEQDPSVYPIRIEEGSQNHFIAGNVYADACSRPNVYVQTVDSTRYLQLDANAWTGDSEDSAPIFNDGDFFRLDALNERVIVGDGSSITLHSDASSTSQLTMRISRRALSPQSSAITKNSTPSVAVGAAAGRGASATIFGSDTSCLIRLDTGTSPSTGTLFTISWATERPSTHYTVAVTAASSGSVVAMQRLYVDQGTATTTAVSVVATTALPASTFFKFYFHVLQY